VESNGIGISKIGIGIQRNGIIPPDTSQDPDTAEP